MCQVNVRSLYASGQEKLMRLNKKYELLLINLNF